MSWTMDCVKYWIYLKQKGWFDESFYNEYDFVCREKYLCNNKQVLEESNRLQAETLLQGA